MNMSDQNINKLAVAIAVAIANPDIVNRGKIRNPYKQFDFTVANGAIETIDYSFDFWRMLTLSTTTGVTLRFGKTGTPTDIVGAGVGNRLPDPVGAFQIINNSGGVLTGTVGLAIGDIFDDRLNISGSIEVATATQLVTVADVTAAASGAGSPTQILAANSTRKRAIITNTHQVHPLRVGDSDTNAARGCALEAGQSLIMDTTDAIFAQSTKPFTIDVAITTEEQ